MAAAHGRSIAIITRLVTSTRNESTAVAIHLTRWWPCSTTERTAALTMAPTDSTTSTAQTIELSSIRTITSTIATRHAMAPMAATRRLPLTEALISPTLEDEGPRSQCSHAAPWAPMEAMDRVHVVHESRKTTTDEDRLPTATISRAWVLDTVAFHQEFDDLYDGIDTSEGLARMRWLATQTWRSTDETTHHYVDLLRTYSADDWEVAYDEVHLVDWYRVLMASHLRELPA